MTLSFGSKLLGFFRDVVLSYFYGVSSVTDAFLISQLIPMSILEFIGLGLLTGYIPLYDEIDKKYGKIVSENFTNKIVNLIILIGSIFIIIGFVFTKQIVFIFASGFEGETLKLTILFTRITLFSIYFVTLGYIFKGYLQIHENYLTSVMTGYPLNIITILGIIFSIKTSVILLPISSLIAIIVQFIILMMTAYVNGYRFRIAFPIFDENIKKLLKLSIPMIVGISVNQINIIVDRTLASRILEGGISALNYANKLNFFVQGMFVFSLTTVMYPIISKLVANEDFKSLKYKLKESINIINIILIPVSIGIFVFSREIIILLFGRGAFDSKAIEITSNALVFYSIGTVSFGLREVLSRTFYALKDTKTPMINASIGLVINIILNIILSQYMGIGGLALATSISAVFTTTLLFINLQNKIGLFGVNEIISTLVKVVIASLCMGFLCRILFGFLRVIISGNISLIITIIFGIIVYFIIISFMKIEDVDLFFKEIKNKLH